MFLRQPIITCLRRLKSFSPRNFFLTLQHILEIRAPSSNNCFNTVAILTSNAEFILLDNKIKHLIINEFPSKDVFNRGRNTQITD